MQKAWVDKFKCIGCGACVGVCPTEAIIMTEDQKAFVKEDLCIGCGACVGVCPTEAIEMK